MFALLLLSNTFLLVTHASPMTEVLVLHLRHKVKLYLVDTARMLAHRQLGVKAMLACRPVC